MIGKYMKFFGENKIEEKRKCCCHCERSFVLPKLIKYFVSDCETLKRTMCFLNKLKLCLIFTLFGREL